MERLEFLKKDYVQGFPANCGFEVERVAYGIFESRLKIRSVHRQQGLCMQVSLRPWLIIPPVMLLLPRFPKIIESLPLSSKLITLSLPLAN